MMSFTFKSQACADLLMLEKPAKELLEIIGKPPSSTGIIEVETMPAAIAALQKAIRDEKNRPHPDTSELQNTAEEEIAELDAPVSLHQRAWPLIEMLNAAYEAKKPIVWGV